MQRVSRGVSSAIAMSGPSDKQNLAAATQRPARDHLRYMGHSSDSAVSLITSFRCSSRVRR